MAEWAYVNADWGYWINPETFKMLRVKTQVRVGAVVITKERQTIDKGRTIISTFYAVARQNGIDSMGKRDASKVLAKQMLGFMRTKNMLTPHTETKKTFSNGNVDLSYSPSEYDSFTIRFTPAMVGDDVEDFLHRLKDFDEGEDTPLSESWRITPARSGRADCRTCGNTIQRDELRLGEPSMYEGHLSYRWHHLSCAAGHVLQVAPESLKGYEDLTGNQRNELRTVVSLEGLFTELNRSNDEGESVEERCMRYLNSPRGEAVMENLTEGESFTLQATEHTLQVVKKYGKPFVSVVKR